LTTEQNTIQVIGHRNLDHRPNLNRILIHPVEQISHRVKSSRTRFRSSGHQI
jgi:hypothetical protein